VPLHTYYSVLDQFLKDNNLSLTQDELKKFISYFTVEKFKKKEHLVVVGQNSSNYFVLQGGLRMYYIDEKEHEYNLKFAFEGWWLGDVVSYINLTGAEYLIQAMEETIVIGITRKSQFEMFEEFPQIKDVYISELERALVWTFQRILDSTKNTANERFLNFMKTYPNFINRISDANIASFIGVSPEYYSKLKKTYLLKG